MTPIAEEEARKLRQRDLPSPTRRSTPSRDADAVVLVTEWPEF